MSGVNSSSGGGGETTTGSSADNGSSEGIILFLSVCLLLGCLCRLLVLRFPRVPLPFTVLLLFVGVVMGSIAQYSGSGGNSFQDAIFAFSALPPKLALYIFLPVLIFDSAFNVHFHLFWHSLWSALLLAFPGALVALSFVAIVAVFAFDYGWSWAEALMLGSILSSTDPVAVVGMLRELGSEQSLATLIEAESLLNDGSAFVVYLLTQSILIQGNTPATQTIIGQLCQYAIGHTQLSSAVCAAELLAAVLL
jgi:NhaP-type Na+/H+ or K+/H+ antiporter